MARTAVAVALVAVVALAAAGSASASAQVCNPGLTPAAPKNVRVKSNVWNGKNAEVVVEWDNPTNMNTGCIQQFRVETTNMKAWAPISNPLASPVQYKFNLNAGSKVDVKVAGYNTQSTKYSSFTSLPGGVTGVAAPPVTTPGGGGMQLCSKTAMPATPTNLKVKSNVWNPSTKRSEIVLEWNGSTNPNAGCVKYFTITSFTSGGSMKDNKNVNSPAETYFTHPRLLSPGQNSRYEVVAVGYDGKVSNRATLNAVVGAGAGATTGRRLL